LINGMLQMELLVGLIMLVVAVVGVGYAIRLWTAKIDRRLRCVEEVTGKFMRS
jgi:cell division protein FtsL